MTTYRSIESVIARQWAKKDSSRMIAMTFPSDSDTVYIDHSRFGAFAWDTSATATVNGRQIKIYPTGAITDVLQIKPGWNVYHFVIKNSSKSDSLDFHLFRKFYGKELPEEPVRISDETMQPRSSMTYYAPDEINVRILGSPGGEAQFKIGQLTHGYLPMVELSPSETGGKRGVYVGTYKIQPGDYCKNQKVKFSLKGHGWHHAKRKSGARITVFNNLQPVVLKTTDEHTRLYITPGDELIGEIPAGIVVEGVWSTKQWWKVRLSANQIGYIRQNSVEVLPAGTPYPEFGVYSISGEADSDWVRINFNISGQPPFAIKQTIDPQELNVLFYHTHFENEWTRYPENDSLISTLDWDQNGEDLNFHVRLNTNQQWGYRGEYIDGKFRLSIRKPPVITKEHPFQNLIIALDAGHGGVQKGAVGATGLMEKDVNLVYTKYLAAMLDSAGAKVILTRDTDSTMMLQPRADIARENNVHMMFWLHNNSTGMLRNPAEIKGTSTYYTHLQGWPFAKAVYPHLLALGLEPESRVHRTYFMTRQTDYVVFLVEGAFLSNPTDEAWLMHDSNLKALARAVFLGVNDRLQTLAH